jgi:leader peptidase (prepilin peptidase) / N-methyltransferase
MIDLFSSFPLHFALAVGILGLAAASLLNRLSQALPSRMEREWAIDCRALLQAKGELAAGPEVAEPAAVHSPCRLWLRLAVALVGALTAWRFGFGWQGGAAIFLTWVLLLLTLIDLRTQLLRDIITQPLLWLGLLLNLGGLFTTLPAAVLGAVFGYLSLWIIFHVFRLLTGKEGMGYGDFKLLALLGAWLGWQVLPLVLLLSALLGAVVGLALIIWGGHDRRQPIPFGPWLALAGWVALLAGDQLLQIWP